MRCVALALLVPVAVAQACDRGAPPADGRLHLEGLGVVRRRPDPAFPEEGRYVVAGARTARGGCRYSGGSPRTPPAARGAARFAEYAVEEDRLRCRLLMAWTTAAVPAPAAPAPGERTDSVTWTTTLPAPPGPPAAYVR